MSRHLILILFLLGVKVVSSQDTISFDRASLWKYESSELNETGKVFFNQVCDTIIHYRKKGSNVKILYTEEDLKVTSIVLTGVRASSLKKYCNEYDAELADIEIQPVTVYVEDFKHLAPHFISYHISLILN